MACFEVNEHKESAISIRIEKGLRCSGLNTLCYKSKKKYLQRELHDSFL